MRNKQAGYILGLAGMLAGGYFVGDLLVGHEAPPKVNVEQKIERPIEVPHRHANHDPEVAGAPQSSPEIGKLDTTKRVEYPTPGTAPAATYHPRDASEWQGMLVDLSIHPQCVSSEDCGLARACIDGACTACSKNLDCAAGEVCSLDHCVVSENAECSGRSDCQDGQKCVLTGLSNDLRNNAGMKALCRSEGEAFSEEEPPEVVVVPAPHEPPPVDDKELLLSLSDAWSADEEP
jgi:hypothetical protein